MRVKYNLLLINIAKFFLLNLVPIVSFSIIFLFLFASIFSYYLIPQNTNMSNEIELSIAKKNLVFQLIIYTKR